MRMVRLQVGQEKVKERVEEERQKLQALADEACSYMPLQTKPLFHQYLGCITQRLEASKSVLASNLSTR